MIDKNQIYLRNIGPKILCITKIIDKSIFIMDNIKELTELRNNSRDMNRSEKREIKDYIDDKDDNYKKN